MNRKEMRKELAELKKSVEDKETQRDIHKAITVFWRLISSTADPVTKTIDPELVDAYQANLRTMKRLIGLKERAEENRPKRVKSARESRARKLPKGKTLLAEYERLLEKKGTQMDANSVLYQKYPDVTERAIRDKIKAQRDRNKKKTEDSER